MPIPVPAIEYRTVTSAETRDLDRTITGYLAKGWSLWGTPYAVNDVDEGTQYCQAVVLLKQAD